MSEIVAEQKHAGDLENRKTYQRDRLGRDEPESDPVEVTVEEDESELTQFGYGCERLLPTQDVLPFPHQDGDRTLGGDEAGLAICPFHTSAHQQAQASSDDEQHISSAPAGPALFIVNLN